MKNASFSTDNACCHSPVMLDEVIAHLRPGRGGLERGGLFVDATVGTGGHSEAIMSSAGAGARLIGLDADPDAARASAKRLEPFGDRVSIVNANFSDIENVLEKHGAKGADGIVADLGVSSRQIFAGGRGFSFRADEPLDMRMDTSLKTTAADIVNTAGAKELAAIFRGLGEERFAGAVASAIVKSREKEPVLTARALGLIVSDAIPKKFHPPRTHPATRTFQALRIKVNDEMGALKTFMEKAPALLNAGARLVVISFHSLEDRVVKRAFSFFSSDCVCPPGLPQCGCGKTKTLKVVTKKPVKPSGGEVERNPRARSAKVRAAERV
ncbi:MAG: 16S rRNA (cytosine(1402)-N(4))-methyltransferase RsmH [Candidatus Dadabacteria bacterium]|nr:16S rRNA (cytosine(1402)-N(4))-methyltransferase RsmH [Candidatus Dadabacteria bacterium]